MNKKLYITIVLINVLLLCFQYIVAGMRATDGQILADLDRELQQYTSQNQQMRNSIYSSLALHRIHQKAIEQNMAPLQTSFLGPNPVAAVFSH